MGCCGGGKTRPAAVPAVPVSDAQTMLAQAGGNGSDKLVRYSGLSAGKRHWRAPSGKVYAFGGGEPLKLVAAGDAAWFAQMPEFQVVQG